MYLFIVHLNSSLWLNMAKRKSLINNSQWMDESRKQFLLHIWAVLALASLNSCVNFNEVLLIKCLGIYYTKVSIATATKHLIDGTHIIASSFHLDVFHLLIRSTFLSLPRESPQGQQSFSKQWQHSKYLSVGTACTRTRQRSGSGCKKKLCSCAVA